MDIIVHKFWGSVTPPRDVRQDCAKAGILPATVIVKDLPSREAFVKAVESMSFGESVKVEAQLGAAFCHPLDDFSKKIGREKAEADLETVELEVSGFNVSPTMFAVGLYMPGTSIHLIWRKGRVRPEVQISSVKFRDLRGMT